MQAFKEAQQYVQEQQSQGSLPPENVRGRLYGLGKQVTEGDCRMPCPPAFVCIHIILHIRFSQLKIWYRSNTVLRAKWDAWMGCQGLNQEKAMTEYLSIVKKAFPQFKGAIASTNLSDMSGVSLAATHSSTSSIVKQGTLYKQRDVFKGNIPCIFA